METHETQRPQERRTRSMKAAKLTKDDMIDLLIAISIICKRIAKKLNTEIKEGSENE